MLSDIIFLEDEMAVRVCSAWAHSDNPKEIAALIGMGDVDVAARIEKLKKLGILLPDKKISDDADKYIKTIVANKIKDIRGPLA